MEKYISGVLLRKMIVNAAHALDTNKDFIDKLNVFPVPDGDTGTNMSLTMCSVINELSQCTNNNIVEICNAISKGALKGARGNSGVILSQILKGIAQTMSTTKNVEKIDAKVFAKAIANGSDMAFKAVSKPKEGTILTVIRDMATSAKGQLKKSTQLDEFFKGVIDGGLVSLKNTPELLPVLKQAGVVDSGGQGLLFVFQGFYNAICGIEYSASDLSFSVNSQVDTEKMFHADFGSLADIEFAYCTEFFVINLHKKTTEAQIDKFKEYLMTIGDCVLVIGGLELVKVHVHTNDPGLALSAAISLGEIDGLKIENMMEQFRKIVLTKTKQKDMGMVAVCSGDGLVSVFKECLVDAVVQGGQTMNPSAQDIADACDKVGAKDVFVLPNNSNIILAAEQAKELVEKCKIHVIPTKNIPQGFSAVLGFDPSDSVENNKENMMASFSHVKSGAITYAVKDSNIDGIDLKSGDIIGLDSSKIAVKGQSVDVVMTDLVDKMVDSDTSNITIYFGSEVAENEAKRLAKEIGDKYKKCDVDCLLGGQDLYHYIVSIE